MKRPVIATFANLLTLSSWFALGGPIHPDGGDTTATIASLMKIFHSVSSDSVLTFSDKVPGQTKGLTALLTSSQRLNETMELMSAHTPPSASRSKGPTTGASITSLRLETADLWSYGALHWDHFVQVVTVAVGESDSRFARVPVPPGVVVYELDVSQELLDSRRSLIQQNRNVPAIGALNAIRQPVVADLTQPHWENALLEQGFNPALKTLWVCEGILYYLDGTVVENFFKTITSLSPQGVRVVGDAPNDALVPLYGPSNPMAPLGVHFHWGLTTTWQEWGKSRGLALRDHHLYGPFPKDGRFPHITTPQQLHNELLGTSPYAIVTEGHTLQTFPTEAGWVFFAVDVGG